MSPGSRTHYLRGSAYFKQHRYEEAEAEFRKAVQLSGNASFWLADLGCFYGATGKRRETIKIVKEVNDNVHLRWPAHRSALRRTRPAHRPAALKIAVGSKRLERCPYVF